MKIQCLVCDKKNSVQPQRRGNIFIEIILWCFYLVPGLIYTLWRNGGNEYTCPICKSKSVKILELEEVPQKNPSVTGLDEHWGEVVAKEQARQALKKEEKKSRPKTSKAAWYALGISILVMFFTMLIIGMVANSKRFEVNIANGSYTKISNNLIETKQKTFDLNLETKGVKSLTIDNKSIQASNNIKYPITLTDDRTLRIEAKNKKSETKTVMLKVDFLTEAEITERAQEAEAKRVAQAEALKLAQEKAKAEKDQLFIDALKREIASIDDGIEMSFIEESKTADFLVLGLAPVAGWGELVEDAQKNENQEIKQLGQELERKAARAQQTIFPRIRKQYAKILRELVWEFDVDVRLTGTHQDVLVITGNEFVLNRNIKAFQQQLKDSPKLFRFEQVRYKWSSYTDESTYYDLKSLNDATVSNFLNTNSFDF